MKEGNGRIPVPVLATRGLHMQLQHPLLVNPVGQPFEQSFPHPVWQAGRIGNVKQQRYPGCTLVHMLSAWSATGREAKAQLRQWNLYLSIYRDQSFVVHPL